MQFNETYYLAQNQDVATEVEEGLLSAEEHWLEYGANEGRNPNEVFNTSEYLEANPDVAESDMNPLTHFLEYGAAEGRAPNAAYADVAEGFDEDEYLAANEDVANAIDAGDFENGYQHWVMYGQFEDDRPEATVNGTPVSEVIDAGAGTPSDLTEPLSLEEARAAKDADNLPAEYTLQDSVANMETAARDLYDDAESIIVVGSVDELTDGGELVDIAGAADTTYQIEDTLANIVAADDSLVDNAEEGYVLTDDTEGLIFEDAKADSEEVVVLAGAKNSDDYSYTLQDTVENLKNAEDGVVEGAESVDITDYEEGDLGGEVTVAEAILIQKADIDVDYTVKDTAENILAAQDELEGVEFTVSDDGIIEDVSVEDAEFLQNAENARDIDYSISGTVDELTSDSGNLLSVVTGAKESTIVDSMANIAGASAGVINAVNNYTIFDSLENLAAGESSLVQDAEELQLTDGEGEEIAEDGFDLGTLSVAEAAIVQKAVSDGNVPKDAGGSDVTYQLDIQDSYEALTTEASDNDDLLGEDLSDVLGQGDVTLVNDTVDGNGGTGMGTDNPQPNEANENGETRDSDMDLDKIGKSDQSSVVPADVVSDFSGLTVESDWNQGYANYTNADGETTFTIANVASQVKDAEDNFDVFKAGITVNDTVNDTVSFDDPLKLNLSGNAEDSFYSVKTPATVFDITAEEGNSGVVSLDSTTTNVGDEVASITVKGAGDLSFQDLAFSNLSTLDASKSEGDISFGNIDKTTNGDFSGDDGANLKVADDFTATTGSGNDTIDLTNVGTGGLNGEVAVSTGAGNDEITANVGLIESNEGSKSLELSGGKGNDSFVLSGSNSDSETVTITDFFRGDNTLTLEGVEGALKLGENLGEDGVNVAFDDASGNNTTLTVNTDDSGSDANMTIELAGVSGDDLAVEDGNIVIA
ncbi:hypothetical protein P1P91_05880 [Halomonas piscis]|uniref:Uncharacterized protein n=1 Tax=Halomonas piscis TaxID=3031727 RepID=A0ABY9Z2E2_9GAMM|nr:hypothetical protein [Halomonas piscis]WNK21202.1 hypothetical protein P1P91_05880 [Halomonas piscis]